MQATAERPNPLRQIVQVLVAAPDVYSRQKVKLECGHEVWCSSAATYRARCRHCAPGVTRLDGETPGQNHQGVDASGFGEGNRG